MPNCTVCDRPIHEKYARFGTCYEHSKVPKPDNVADIISGGLSEVELYWKKHKKNIIQLAHDVNQSFIDRGLANRVAVPNTADEGWELVERQRRYMERRSSRYAPPI